MIQPCIRLLTPLLVFVLAGCAEDVQEIVLTKAHMIEGREEISLNHNWEFHKGSLSAEDQAEIVGSEAEEKVWESIDLPHTWNAEDGYDGGSNYFRGDGWYRKRISIDKRLSGKRFYLHFDGANLITDVYIDGISVGNHRGGYGAFRFDLTPYLQAGVEHELAIKVNNERHEDIAPLSADYTFFGGIYRDLSLLVTGQDHIELLDYASPGVFLHQQVLTDEQAKVRAEINLINKGSNNLERQLQVSIKKQNGELVEAKSTVIDLPPGERVTQNLILEIDQPRRWNGVKDPYLYTAVVQLMDGEKVIDSVTQPLGLRSFKVDPEKGLYLNGEYYDVKGVSRHQDLEGKGWALNEADHLRDFDIIEEMGATGVRLAHYQHDPYVYKLMDKKGFVTWAEIPVINEVPESAEFEVNAVEQLKELIRQNFNHPSILFWGTSNEVSMGGLSQGGVEVLKRLNALAKQEDNQRLTTAAVLGHHDGEDVWYVNDVVAQNVYYGWYYDAIKDIGRWADESREAYPNRAFGVSEYGAGAGPSIHSATPVKGDHSEEFQNLYHEGSWNEMKARPFIWSKFIWNMFDFAVDSRDEGERPGMNDKGLVSYDRETYKDSFYWYKANWSQEPVLYITSRRFVERKRTSTDIKIYTNLPAAELIVNGISLGSKTQVGDHSLVWESVALNMGENTIKVVGADAAGKQISDRVEWTRIENDDTRLAAVDGVLGIDLENHRVYHVPYGTTVEQLESLISLPYGAELDMALAGSPNNLVTVGDQFEVIAGNGNRQAYQIAEGTLSVARPIKVDRELAHGIMGYPAAPAVKAVDGNDDISISREDASKLDVSPFWLTGDPSGERGQIKIDLGADFYIDRLVSSWLPAAFTENGTMKYTVDLASDVTLDETVFFETYQTIIDKTENEVSLRTKDSIEKVGRYIQVNMVDSSYVVDIPFLGELKLFGAAEISVEGGLLFSETLTVDYRRHVISISPGVTAEKLKQQLSTISEEYSLTVEEGGRAVSENQPLTKDYYVVVASNNKGNARKERYDLVMSVDLKKLADND
jgi:Glycosyl hydrolases family 2, TIM barrel domain/Glycosyl hydrolases family 2, sugar binding domain/Glycosyl hydrolases family 2/Domain of unknown function (DUF4982)